MTGPQDPVRLDPISLEVWWSRLAAITDEAATALLRTAFSTIIRESSNYTVVLMDPAGQTIAECRACIPAFAMLIGVLTRQLLARFPAETWRDGDVVITNDPWLGTGPALFGERETSCAVGPDCRVGVDTLQNLISDIDYGMGEVAAQ
jgi:N-methylhydantoinase B